MSSKNPLKDGVGFKHATAERTIAVHTTAVGLGYSVNSESPPTIAVKGDNFEADEIVRIAKRFGIPIIAKKELARALKVLNLDEKVPAQLFEAVALVIAQVDKKIK